MNEFTIYEHDYKDYKENVKHTENWHGWQIEIESDVELYPDWFDPDYDDHWELEEIELEKGYNFYITQDGITYKGLWSFRHSESAINAAKKAIRLRIEGFIFDKGNMIVWKDPKKCSA